MAAPVYLSPKNTPLQNYELIAKFDARITKAYADQLDYARAGGIKTPATDLPNKDLWSYSTWAALALFVAGFFVARIVGLRSGLCISAGGVSLFVYTRYQAENLPTGIEGSPDSLKYEADKTKKIYEAIIQKLAESYIHKTNFVFEKVNRVIREKNLQDIRDIFAAVIEQVDKYDLCESEFENRDDLGMAILYSLIKPHALNLITGAKTIAPGEEYMGIPYVNLSILSWKFVYGAGINPSVDWAPPGQTKRYFLLMKPSQDGQSWTVEKFIPEMLKPF